jgi:tetratricopeptide (TPR) repeat protein
MMIGRGRRALAGAAMILAAMMLVSPAAAESVPEWKCNASSDVPSDERIAACTAVIDARRYGRQGLIRAYFSRAAAYNKRGDFERAIADYSQLIQFYPKNMYAYLCRGLSYFRSGNLDRAIADFTQTIQLNPNNYHAYYDRGVAHYHSGYDDSAIADYDQAIRLNPTGGQAYLGRGAVFYRKGNHDRAIADYEQVIRLDPKNKDALAYRAAAYYAKGDVAAAIADYDRLIELDPNDARPYRGRAIANLAGSPAKSLADLNQSSALDPKDAYTALWLEIAAKRNNLPGRLTQATAQLDMNKWPAPVIRLFLGEMMPEAVLAAAEDPNPEKQKGQICQANFFAGELALQRGAKEDAARSFRLASAGCPSTFTEWLAANAELRMMNLEP